MPDAVAIIAPGIVTGADKSKYNRALRTLDGFPKDNLKSGFLFEEGAGTSIANIVDGGAPATITSLVSSNNAYTWQPVGGVEIAGGQIIAAPAITDLRKAWAVVMCGMLTGSVASSPSYQRISFYAALASNFRGIELASTGGGANWNPPTSSMNYSLKPSNGSGGLLTGANLAPGNSTVAYLTNRILVVGYDGLGSAYAAVYDQTGALLQSGSVATSDFNMVNGSIGGEVDSVQPIFGPYNSAPFAGGKQIVDVGLFYEFPLEGDSLNRAEILAIAAAYKAKTDLRGR